MVLVDCRDQHLFCDFESSTVPTGQCGGSQVSVAPQAINGQFLTPNSYIVSMLTSVSTTITDVKSISMLNEINYIWTTFKFNLSICNLSKSNTSTKQNVQFPV